MEQYKQYLKETYAGQDCYIDEQNRGWASFKIDGDECYINHCFILPEFRSQTLMREICSHIEIIAKNSGCKFMTGTVQIGTGVPERSLRMMMSGGYTVFSAQDNIIVMIKHI